MLVYSIIIPLYNRPEEIDELLASLTKQSFTNFEVLVVEDGSENNADEVCGKYAGLLDIKYFYKQNEGPGMTRNYGCTKAKSAFFIFFDSDCIIPPDYFEKLNEKIERLKPDAYGGPDAADKSFTPVQKAINYSMTSAFTTGGIRGGKKSLEKFHPRSFNMGITREVFEKTGGFSKMRFGEDIDFSIRILEAGFQTALITECFVYHKRRTDFKKFYKQVFNSGIARINLFKKYPRSLKLLHFFPAAFTILLPIAAVYSLLFLSIIPVTPFMIYFFVIFTDSWKHSHSVKVAGISIWATLIQLMGYGLGFIKAYWNRIIMKKGEFHDFEKNFYE